MADILDKERVLEGNSICRIVVSPNKLNVCIDDILSRLSKLEAADAQPVKRGHWYHNTSKYVSELDAYFIQACCSCCGRYSDRIDQYSQIMSNETCSHCGADMRGDA